MQLNFVKNCTYLRGFPRPSDEVYKIEINSFYGKICEYRCKKREKNRDFARGLDQCANRGREVTFKFDLSLMAPKFKHLFRKARSYGR